ncbi:hypothetical protein QTP88_024188 [Uroleucon formosanum]
MRYKEQRGGGVPTTAGGCRETAAREVWVHAHNDIIRRFIIFAFCVHSGGHKSPGDSLRDVPGGVTPHEGQTIDFHYMHGSCGCRKKAIQSKIIVIIQ